MALCRAQSPATQEALGTSRSPSHPSANTAGGRPQVLSQQAGANVQTARLFRVTCNADDCPFGRVQHAPVAPGAAATAPAPLCFPQVPGQCVPRAGRAAASVGIFSRGPHLVVLGRHGLLAREQERGHTSAFRGTLHSRQPAPSLAHTLTLSTLTTWTLTPTPVLCPTSSTPDPPPPTARQTGKLSAPTHSWPHSLQLTPGTPHKDSPPPSTDLAPSSISRTLGPPR